MGDNLDKLFAYLRNQYEPREDAMGDLTDSMRLGQIPQAFVAAAAGRGYAESLIKPAGCWVGMGTAEVAGPRNCCRCG